MGHARYTYRVRVSAAAERALLAEWGRCRWVWNQCVAGSRQAWKDKRECGPAGLDKMLTGWRAEHEWLRAGSSVAQKQTVRDFGKSRARALRDRRNKIPAKRRAGLPQFRKRDRSLPTVNYTKQGFTLRDGKLTLAGGIAVRVVWSRELPSVPGSVRVYQDALGRWYASFVVETQAQPYPQTGGAIGIDWGVKDIAVTTNGAHDLPHPEFGLRRHCPSTRPRAGPRGEMRHRAQLMRRIRPCRAPTRRTRTRQGHVRRTARTRAGRRGHLPRPSR
jgi:putative transposase